MVAALVAGSLFTKQLLWTPISAINMIDVITNQFKMTGASFAGMDKNGEPFKLRAASARQEYQHPDIIFMERVSGTTTRVSNGQKIVDTISANTGKYDRSDKTIKLNGNVHIDSSNGDRVITKELVIRL